MTKSRKYVPTIGSISHGTLRAEDLLDSFLWELCQVAPRKHGALKRGARKALAICEKDGECDPVADEIVNELQDALSEHAPPFMYFGNTEGDGSDFGWWPSWSEIEELPQFDDGAPKDFYGEFKSVSDHGNVEIYVRFGNGRVKSLLGVV